MSNDGIVHPDYLLPYDDYVANLKKDAVDGLEEAKLPKLMPGRIRLANEMYELACENEHARRYPTAFILFHRLAVLYAKYIGRSQDAGVTSKGNDAFNRCQAMYNGGLKDAWELEMTRVRQQEAAASEESARQQKERDDAAAAAAARAHQLAIEAERQSAIEAARIRAIQSSAEAGRRVAAEAAERQPRDARLDALANAADLSRTSVTAPVLTDSLAERFAAMERKAKEERIRRLEMHRAEELRRLQLAAHPPSPAPAPAAPPPPPPQQWYFTAGAAPLPRGMRNLGNTCYMNSTTQALVASGGFVRHLLRGRDGEPTTSAAAILSQKAAGPPSPLSSGGAVTRAFVDAVVALSARGLAVPLEPRTLKNEIGRFNSDFGNFEQHDAHEFTRCLLDAMHEDLNLAGKRGPRPPSPNPADGDHAQVAQAWLQYVYGNYSPVTRHFAFVERSTLRCPACGGLSKTFTTAYSLEVQVPPSRGAVAGVAGAVSLYDCLALHTADERLETTWRCPACSGDVVPTKRIVLVTKPSILIISFKRFGVGHGAGWGSDGFAAQKLTTPVVFPPSLDVSPYVAPDSRDDNMVYTLTAIVNHSGTLNSGHYTADVRGPDGGWYSISDERAVPSSGTPRWGDAYMLYYTTAPEGHMLAG